MGLVIAVSAQAQQSDFWAGAEVVMGQMGPSTIEQIRQSPELQVAYDGVLLEQYLAQESARRGLAERLDVQRALSVARRSVLVQALRDDVYRSSAAPSDADIKSAYQKDPDRWGQPAAYQLDVFRIANDDGKARAAAAKLQTGKAVNDEDLATLVAARPQVTRASGAWLVEQQLPPVIWSALREMQPDEVRLFPDSQQTLVVRKGTFRAERRRNVEEAEPFVRQELLRTKGDLLWSNYLNQARARIAP